MKFKLLYPFLMVALLVACSAAGGNPTAIPTVVLGGSQATSVPGGGTAGGQLGGVTASGVIVANQTARMAFSLPGNVTRVNVAVGDNVQAGQVLVQLDDQAQQVALEQADLALQQLSSPDAIANAQIAVTTAQKDVTDAQYAVNNQLYWQNPQLIQDQYSRVVIAKDNLDKAQQAYDRANVGDYINNAGEAALYQALYNAQQAYDNAEYYYSLYSQKPTERAVNEAQAKLDLANATLQNARDYLAVLQGGEFPQAGSGSALAAYQQAKLAIQTAQHDLDATRMVAPFTGEVGSVSVSIGDYVSPGQVVLVLSDVNNMHVETTDLSERDVPSVKVGQSAEVSIKALNQVVNATVSAISPLAQSLGGDVVYTVELELGDLPAGVLAGMSVDVQFNPTP